MSAVNPSTIVIQTALDPAVAFEFVADPVNETEWNPGAMRVERLSPAPVTAGSTFRVVGKTMGRDMTVDVAVMEVDAPRRTRTRAASGPMRFDTTYLVERTGSGASVTMSVAVSVEGPLRLAGPLIRAVFDHRLNRLAPRLKAAMEAHPATGATGG